MVTLGSFRERPEIIYGNEFDWSYCRQELHVAFVAILRIFLGTTCAVAYDTGDACNHMGPIERLSGGVVHTTLAGVSAIGG